MSRENTSATIKVGGRALKVSNLDKLLFPATGFTKGQVIDYYVRIAPLLLPHLRRHPVTMKRFPEGVEAEFFYEKRCPIYRPAWMSTSDPQKGRDGRADVSYCVVDSLPALVWAVNLASIEFHALLSTSTRLNRPTMMVFDLDPGPSMTLSDCAALAVELREVLAGIRLESYPRVSGGKGVHVCVPLNTDVTFEETGPVAKAIAQAVERAQPSRVTTNMRKSLRHGRVFIDWSQNAAHKTTVCTYSLRAQRAPLVAAPVTWKELERAAGQPGTAALTFAPGDMLARIDRYGDLMEPLLTQRQRLPGSAPRLNGHRQHSRAR